ncbi:MAG: flagellar hook-length control protein FliK [Rhodobacterales bacterium]|nr:flagellar hook-length control protein FliK [Rhodobacterales bacterium]
MLNTPLAALSPTSAPETAKSATKPDKPRQDAIGQATRDDAENGKGFSEFYQEADTSQGPKQASNDPQQIDQPDLRDGKPDQATATSDGPASADSDLISSDLIDFEATLIAPQNANYDADPLAAKNTGFAIPTTGGTVETAVIADASGFPPLRQGQITPAAGLPVSTANNTTLAATPTRPQPVPSADPNILPVQNIAALNQSQTSTTNDVLLAPKNTVSHSITDPLSQIINPTLRTASNGGLAPEMDARPIDGQGFSTPGATEQSKSVPPLATANPSQSLGMIKMNNPPSQPPNATHTATVLPDTTRTVVSETVSGSGAAAQLQTANALVQNPQVIVSNLGQQQTATARNRDSRTSLPPTAESAAIAARANTTIPTNSKPGAPQTATPANALALLDHSKPGEAAIKWQADAELAFDPKLDPRAAVTGTGIGTSRSDPVFHRPEIPRQVAAQLADIAQRIAGKSVQLSLNPEELGRVKLSLTPAETGMVVTVVAERGETLDLMRRNIDILAQEFRAIGYDDISFSFGQQNSDSAGHSPDDTGDPPFSAAKTDGPMVADQQKPYQISLSPTDGIDIRV